MNVRSMTVDDIASAMRLAAVVHLPEWSAQNYVNEIANPAAYFLVAEGAREPERADTARESVVIGMAGAHIVADEIEVLIIAVHPDHQHTGLGTRLLSQLLSEAAARGARNAWLDVRERNEPASRLYLRHGFQIVHRRKRYYKDGEDALIMSLTLA